jgi:hypothetical protein
MVQKTVASIANRSNRHHAIQIIKKGELSRQTKGKRSFIRIILMRK